MLMRQDRLRSACRQAKLWTIVLLLVLSVCPMAQGKHKKNEKKQEEQATPYVMPKAFGNVDLSKIVWPPPPSIARIKYLDYFCCSKWMKDTTEPTKKKKASWMDRLAGGQSQKQIRQAQPFYGLWVPNGVAADSKGNLYVADSRVSAIFIFNTETKDLSMIRNGRDARFGVIAGLAMDDNDRLFVSDLKLKHVLIFNPKHKLEGILSGPMVEPTGLAIDTENRFLYVVDTGSDQVLVFDADNYNLIRKIGVAGKNHGSTTPGEFAKPSDAAVDKDGNLYVTDTLNHRVEEFDADGEFIRTFGSNGDGPGHFAVPKGIGVDSDGFVWVADAMLDRIQLFTPDGHFVFGFGTRGSGPGQFGVMAGLTIDKRDRVFVSDQYPGRVQMFQYVTEAKAEAEKKRRDQERQVNQVQTSAPAEAAAPPKTEKAP
jgi:DNA-binding beta-propeller fold protein YncE